MKKYIGFDGTICIQVPIAEIVIVALLLIFSAIPAALAEQQPVGAIPENPMKQAVPVTQQIPAKAPDSQSTYGTSVDFLMSGSPVSQSGLAPQAPIVQPVPGVTTPAFLPLQPENGGKEEVSVLVSEQCDQGAEGSASCSRVYSDGHRAKVVTQIADEGDEVKQLAVIEEYDKDNNLFSKKTIKHRVDYNYQHDQKAREQELFDITYQPKGKPTTRELMVYKYYLDTGKPKTFTWTQYKQVGNESKASLAYRASLAYASDGNPDRGIAEQWERGQKVATFLNWSRLDGGFTQPARESWAQWEGWIRNVSLQAYLP